MSLEDVVHAFLSEQEYKQNSPATIRFYAERLTMFRAATEAVDVADLNPTAMKHWLVGLRRRGLSANSIVNYDKALRVFANWLHRSGYTTTNPLAALPKPRPSSTNVMTLDTTDVRKLTEAAKRSRQPLRNLALISLLLDTGIRAGEASSLHLGAVSWSEGTLAISGKTGARVVPFGSMAKRALRRYATYERTAASPAVRDVFLTRHGFRLTSAEITQTIRRLMRSAGIDGGKTGPHTFRHTFALEFIRAGGDAFSLQRLLGHTTLDMTRRCVNLAATDLRSAHKRFAPGDRML